MSISVDSCPLESISVCNITAAWAVDREFVIYIFLGVVGPMVPPGSPDALGKTKTKVFLRLFYGSKPKTMIFLRFFKG